MYVCVHVYSTKYTTFNLAKITLEILVNMFQQKRERMYVSKSDT